MKHTYLVTTSAAALLAGTIFVFAQGMPKGSGAGPEGGAQGQQREQGQTQRDQEQGRGKQGQREQGQKEQGKQGQREQGKQGTTGQGEPGRQGQREERQQGQKNQKDQKDQGRQGQREDRQQGQREQGQKEQGRQGTTGQGKQGQPKEGQSREGQSNQPPRTEGQRQGGNVNLTVEQRTRVRETVFTKGPRATNVNFNIRVGTVVPTSVRIVEIDPILVEYYPNYRGFFYFIVNDEIIIVDRNHRIVAVIDV